MSTSDEGRTVGDVARDLGLTVRTLHHWDDIGLVRPSDRSAAGYRLYSPADVARLERVRGHRELGVPLPEIAALLDAPAGSVEALREQRERLVAQARRIEESITALDRVVETAESGMALTADEQVALFGPDWDPAWAAEARSRWGASPQWAEYAERTARRTPEQWEAVAAEAAGLEAALADALRRGVDPASDEGMALAERHRAGIGAQFHCTVAMHVCLARAFTDGEMAPHWESIEPGLGAWLRAAIEANARDRGVDPATARWE